MEELRSDAGNAPRIPKSGLLAGILGLGLALVGCRAPEPGATYEPIRLPDREYRRLWMPEPSLTLYVQGDGRWDIASGSRGLDHSRLLPLHGEEELLGVLRSTLDADPDWDVHVIRGLRGSDAEVDHTLALLGSVGARVRGIGIACGTLWSDGEGATDAPEEDLPRGDGH